MKFRIPFAGSNIERLKRVSKNSIKKVKYSKDSKIEHYLKTSGAPVTREEYIGICKKSLIIMFFVLLVLSMSVLAFFRVPYFYLFSIGFSFLFTGFILFSQRAYPRVYATKRQRDIEKNLIPALEDILIQLTSGIPLFSIMVNISDSDYGELSVEFGKIVKRINAGESEIDVIDDIGEKNPSLYFKRTLWQISNGLRAGSDMAVVIRNNIESLNEEQMIQIQNYGNKLNPLIMFYMLISVIAPALSVTFLTILASMISLPENATMGLFFGLFILVVLMQIMFLGIIKSRRPSLLD